MKSTLAGVEVHFLGWQQFVMTAREVGSILATSDQNLIEILISDLAEIIPGNIGSKFLL